MLKPAILSAFLLAAVLAESGAPVRYIIQLKDSSEIDDNRQRVRVEIEKHGGRIVDTLKGPFKALIVDSDAKTISRVRKMPGVGLIKEDRDIPRMPPPKNPKS